MAPSTDIRVNSLHFRRSDDEHTMKVTVSFYEHGREQIARLEGGDVEELYDLIHEWFLNVKPS